MEIRIRHYRDIYPIKVDGHLIPVRPKLQDVYQNSPEISNVVMETKRYKDVGCRATAIFRMINQQLIKHGIIAEPIPLVEMDKIADQGGEIKDCWIDNIQSPIYNVLHAFKFMERINKKYRVNLKYKLIRPDQYNYEIKTSFYQMISEGIPFSIKMPNLVFKGWNHFINIDGAVFDKTDEEVFFRMKETYQGYNGYNNFYVKWDKAGYYEIIYMEG